MGIISSEHIEIKDIDDIDTSEIEFKTISPIKLKSDYVNNKELYKEFVEYDKKKKEWKELGKKGYPPLSNKIGHAIIQIAKRRCFSRQFLYYSPDWKEEMIQDAILVATANCHSFNIEKSNNPFAYLTQIISNAVIQRIKMEHIQNYIKLKSYDNTRGFIGDCDDNISEDDMELISATDEMYSNRLEKIAMFEKSKGIDKKIPRKRKSKDDDFNLLNYDAEEEQDNDE